MAHRTSLALRSMGIAAAIWVLVGVPITGLIAALSMSFWVLAAFADMAGTAAVLGAVQGLWFYLVGKRSTPGRDGVLTLGLLSGAFLGALGFRPVFSHTSIIAARPTAALMLAAGVAGGIVSGFIAALILRRRLPTRSSTLRRGIAIGGLLAIGLAAIDYFVYWPAAAERIAVPEITHEEIASLSAGNARGSAWAGCYRYQGKLPLGTGGAFGRLKVAQTDGMLKVIDGSDTQPLVGGVDRDGSFRFGGDVRTIRNPLRVLWQGKFNGHSFQFARRVTVVNGENGLGTNPLTGTAELIRCDF